ncbi:MAG: hypothetical protein CMLOHMNK_01221 [Steroidobacteraceae bacterium]|nr:hypothetical protein [Steroidobacteraceae bacterium]
MHDKLRLTGGRRRATARGVDFLYSLYDALVSVNVPSDKARAVVDAMERDMGTTLATKSDLDSRQLLLRHEFEGFRREMSLEFAAVRKDLDVGLAAIRKDMESGFATVRRDMEAALAAVRKDMEAGLAAVRKDMDAALAAVRRDMDTGLADVRKDMELMRKSLTIQLGSMYVAGMGILFAALRFT